MVDSYFADVIEIASKRRLKFNKKQKPLFEQEFYFDEKDLVFFCRYQNENEIFSKQIQVCLGGYSEKELDEFLTVKSFSFAKSFSYSTLLIQKSPHASILFTSIFFIKP